MALPPPMAAKLSAPAARAACTARSTAAMDGSVSTSLNSVTCNPAASRDARDGPATPSASTAGSTTTNTCRAPSRFSSQPASSAAPGPNFTGVASMVNRRSCASGTSPGAAGREGCVMEPPGKGRGGPGRGGQRFWVSVP